MKAPTSAFPGRLREARTAAGVSMAALAGMCGYGDRQLIHAYESGRVSPTLVLTEQMAAVLGVDPRWLAGWQDEGGPAA